MGFDQENREKELQLFLVNNIKSLCSESPIRLKAISKLRYNVKYLPNVGEDYIKNL